MNSVVEKMPFYRYMIRDESRIWVCCMVTQFFILLNY